MRENGLRIAWAGVTGAVVTTSLAAGAVLLPWLVGLPVCEPSAALLAPLLVVALASGCMSACWLASAERRGRLRLERVGRLAGELIANPTLSPFATPADEAELGPVCQSV